MDIQLLIATTCVTAITSGIIGSIVASVMTAAKGKGKEQVDSAKQLQVLLDTLKPETMEALGCGIRALLWRELRNFHDQAMRDGGLNVEDRNHLSYVYDAYHAIGGNGTGTRLYEDAMETEVLP